MGSQAINYCDSCGDDIGNASLIESTHVFTVNEVGIPVTIYLCNKYDYDGERPFASAPTITGCAKKVLQKDVIKRFYKDVVDYTGEKNSLPFKLAKD